MKNKLFALILFSIFFLSSCSSDVSSNNVSNEAKSTISTNVANESEEHSDYHLTAYYKDESIIINDLKKLLDIAQNCIGILPEAERQSEPFTIDDARENGLLIHVEYNSVQSVSVSIGETTIPNSAIRLYLAIGAKNWIGIQNKENSYFNVFGFQNNEAIKNILSCLELTDEQKDFLLSSKVQAKEPDFVNDITMAAFSNGKEISIVDATTLLYTVETCADALQEYNTFLSIEQLEDLKSEDLWLHISYKNGRNVYPDEGWGPYVASDIYVIIGEQYFISLHPKNGTTPRLMGIKSTNDVDILLSCIHNP